MGTFITEYWHIGVVGACLLALVIDFVRRFLLESQRLKRELSNAIEELRSISGQMNGEWVDLHAVKTKAMQSPSLSHLWAEYAKTLHAQLGEEDELGQRKIMRWRATSLAEAFFTDQAIVDNRLKTDFFKHLPGVLTGLGIIGTFAGLIQGLVNFDVSVDHEAAQTQLQGLVRSVGHAFHISASAISLAMLSTWIEKAIATARYAQVNELRELIDGLFKGGAGEEYLQGLAQSSQDAATHIKHLRDTLVVDLKEVLTSLTHQSEVGDLCFVAWRHLGNRDCVMGFDISCSALAVSLRKIEPAYVAFKSLLFPPSPSLCQLNRGRVALALDVLGVVFGTFGKLGRFLQTG